jgi:hypothetical protein
MADTFTSLLRLVLQETGGNQNIWGDINNASAIDLLEDAIAARLDLDVTPATNPVTLLSQNGDVDQSRNAIIALTGNPGEDKEIIVPSTSKLYIVSNESSPGFDMTIKTVANAGVIVRPATRVAVVVDPVADDVFSIGDVPQATEEVQGVAEIATQAEVDAGTDDERFVTPLKLTAFPAVNQATEDIAGVAEIATQAETDDGSLDDKIVSPLKLEGRAATESLTGLSAIADQTEVDAGTNDTKFVTPLKLATTTPSQPAYRGCKAYQTGSILWARDDAPNATFTGPTNAAAAVAYNAEVFDTDSIHDISTLNSRFVVPSGVTKIKIRVAFNPQLGQGGSSVGVKHALIRLNGATAGTIDPGQASWIPLFSHDNQSGTGSDHGWVTAQTGIINTTGNGTDYFECYILTQAGIQTTQANGAFFEMEIVE